MRAALLLVFLAGCGSQCECIEDGFSATNRTLTNWLRSPTLEEAETCRMKCESRPMSQSHWFDDGIEVRRIEDMPMGWHVERTQPESLGRDRHQDDPVQEQHRPLVDAFVADATIGGSLEAYDLDVAKMIRAETYKGSVHMTKWIWVQLGPKCEGISRAACMSQTRQIGPGVTVDRTFLVTSPIVDIEQVGKRYIVTPKDQHVVCAPRMRDR